MLKEVESRVKKYLMEWEEIILMIILQKQKLIWQTISLFLCFIIMKRREE